MRNAIAMLCLILLGVPVGARAAAGVVAWPTFFRVGPDRHEKVVDELLRGEQVDVQGCTERWCKVQIGRVVGYVERGALNANDFPAAAAASPVGCFESVRRGYGKGELLRFCPR